MTYTGIGSRDCPKNIYKLILKISQTMARCGLTLRSGGADGCDSAFEEGCDTLHGDKEIYLPWKGFNNNLSPLYNLTPEAFNLAEQFHAGYHNLSVGAKKLMARNGYQVMGPDLCSPSDFIVCYTPNGKISGGTGQALRIANSEKIPIYNIFWKDQLLMLKEFTKKNLLPIESFKGEWSFLSNFEPCQIIYNGLTFKNVESAYQAEKCLNEKDRLLFISTTGAEAKKLIKSLPIKHNWDDLKLKVMKDLVKQKFSQQKFEKLLLSTGSRKIVEGNYWKDTYWGVCNNVGENYLGRILMRIRSDKNAK